MARTGPGMPSLADHDVCVRWVIALRDSRALARTATEASRIADVTRNGTHGREAPGRLSCAGGVRLHRILPPSTCPPSKQGFTNPSGSVCRRVERGAHCNGVQRLISMLRRSAPGVGLALLRVSVAASLWTI